MELEKHIHNGIDSSKLSPKNLLGFPIFSTVPTHKDLEGSIVISTYGGNVNLYVMQNETWNIIGSSANSVVTNSSSRLASAGTGQQAITGVGFSPSQISIYSSISEDDGGWCQGRGSSDSDFDYIEKWWDGTNIKPYTGTDRIIKLHKGSSITDADIYSIDSNGFTLDWKTMNDNVAFLYTCYP